MTRAKLLVVGLDAVETPLVQDLMAAGRMPVLTALSERGVSCPVEASCMSSLPGAIWQDILTGRSAWRHGDYYPLRIHTGEAAVREIDPTCHSGSYFFDHAAAAGRRAIVVDLPLVPAHSPPAELTLVSEWHVHDAIWDRGTHPPALLDDLEDRFGKRPYDRCDTNHTDSEDSLRSFAAMLRREMSIKISMVEHLMTTRPWDLCTVGISQGHCAGHQLWHLHDAARAGAGPGKVAHDLVTDTYEAIDAALGRLVAAAGPDCGVVVLTSHGMESYVAGPQFLQPLLESWGFHRPDARRALLRRIVPKGLMGRLFRAAPALRRAAADRGAWTDQLSGTSTAIAVPNNRVGAIRLNVEGREPHGTVTDVDAALTDLENRLAALRHAATDEPIVDHTIRPFETYGPDAHPDLPDLLVVFRQDLGELNDIVCPEAGRLSIGVRRPDYQRTGDHTDRSHFWIDHPDVGGIEQFRSEDVAPTLLALLGVALPDDLDGRVGVKMSSGSLP